MFHVLFVDDDAMVAENVEAALREKGHRCQTADRGDRALALAKAENYDIIVLEVELPDMDGLHFVRRMKLECIDTPVLLQSQILDKEIETEGAALGVTKFLAKPYSVGELIARITSVVGGPEEPDLTPISDRGAPAGRVASGPSASAPAPVTHPEPSWPSSTGTNGSTPTQDGGASEHEAAVITDLNGNPIPCVILTKTEETGTLKLSAPDVDCPKSFTLEPVDGSARICIVRWRKGAELGVEFI